MQYLYLERDTEQSHCCIFYRGPGEAATEGEWIPDGALSASPAKHPAAGRPDQLSRQERMPDCPAAADSARQRTGLNRFVQQMIF